MQKPDGIDRGLEIRFFLREATRRSKEGGSLIESLSSALGDTYLDQRSRKLYDSAQKEICMAVASLDRASENVQQAANPNHGTMRGRRDTKRKKRSVFTPMAIAVPALRRSSRVVTPVSMQETCRRSSRLLQMRAKDDGEK